MQEWFAAQLLNPFLYFNEAEEQKARIYVTAKSLNNIHIYNSKYWKKMIRFMAARIYPSVFKHVGNHRFNQLIISYLLQHPHNDPILRTIGMKFPTWIKEHFPNEEELLVLAHGDWQRFYE